MEEKAQEPTYEQKHPPRDLRSTERLELERLVVGVISSVVGVVAIVVVETGSAANWGAVNCCRCWQLEVLLATGGLVGNWRL